MSNQVDIERRDSRHVTKKVWTTPILSTLGLSQTTSGQFIPGGEDFIMFLAPCAPGQMTFLCS